MMSSFFYKQKNYSILCLQETHFTEKDEQSIELIWGYKCISNPYSTNSRGVAILIRETIDYEIHNIKKDSREKFLAVDLTIDDLKLTLINLYGPNKDEPIFFQQISACLLEFNSTFFIICGDFNLILEPNLDTLNYLHINNPKARQCVLNIMSEWNLIDYYRILNPEVRRYTWRKSKPKKQARLDFFLMSDNLTNYVKKYKDQCWVQV